MAIRNYPRWRRTPSAAILNLFESKIAQLDPPSPNTPPYNQTWSGSDDRLWRYGHLNFFQDGGDRHLGFVRIGNSAIRSAVPENSTLEPRKPQPRTKQEVDRTTGCGDMAIWNFSKMAAAAIFRRHLGFGRTANSAIRSAVPENPTLEPNMKWIGRPVAEIWPFEIFEMRGRSSVVGRRSYDTIR